MTTHEKRRRFCSESIKTSAEYVVLPNSLSLHPRLDQCAQCPSNHTSIWPLDCCEVVHALCRQLSIFRHSSLRVWSQSIGFCQLLLRNLHLVTIEQWCCCLCCLSSWVFAVGQIREIGFKKFWYFTMTSFFFLECTDQTKHKHSGVNAQLIAC